jgi:tetratricopeptide (TPR) repeat protein
MKHPIQTLCYLLACSLASPVIAKPKDKGGAEQAQELFEKASTDYKLQKYEDALANFEEVYRLTNSPAVLFNIGQCYKQLNRLEDALKAFRSFVRDDPKNALRANAEARIQEIEKELEKLAQKGSLQISTQKDPAEIFLDGTSRGSSPLTINELESGDHTLSIKRKGFAEYTATVSIKPSETTSLEALRLVPLDIPELKTAKLLRSTSIGLGGAGVLSTVTMFLLVNSVSNRQENNDPEINADAARANLQGSLTLATVSGVGGALLLTSSVATLALSIKAQKKAARLQSEQEKAQ